MEALNTLWIKRLPDPLTALSNTPKAVKVPQGVVAGPNVMTLMFPVDPVNGGPNVAACLEYPPDVWSSTPSPASEGALVYKATYTFDGDGSETPLRRWLINAFSR